MDCLTTPLLVIFISAIWNSGNVGIRLTQQRKLSLKVVHFEITPKQSYMQLLNSSVIISTSFFLANSVNDTHGPIGYVTGNTIDSLIIVTRSYVVINESTFEKNNTASGETMFIQLGTKVVIINSTFLGNYARENSGVLFVEGDSNVSIIS